VADEDTKQLIPTSVHIDTDTDIDTDIQTQTDRQTDRHTRLCKVLSLVIWTTVTLCSVAPQTVCLGASSRSRTWQRDSSPALVDVTNDHITPVLRLPVRQRVDFKLALLVYKALHDSTAAYLVDDYQLISHADRPTSTRVVSHGPTHGLATRALQPLDRGFGTVCRPGFASPTMTLENFVGS